VKKVVNYNNTFIERFAFDTFNDDTITDGDWDTTDQQLVLTLGQIAKTKEIYKSSTTITKVRIIISDS
jgi:hypothetical protein